MPATPEKLLLAAPRGYCAGVDRAVQAVERALELYGAPVYVRKEIVHNKHVVEQLRDRGAVFVDSEKEVPEGATVVFSAHGVAPSVHANAKALALHTIDATCPLVTKVHVEAKKFAAEGYTIVLIGHAGHEEVEGTMGEAPDHIVRIENEDDVEAREVTHQPAPRALSRDRRPPHRRYLLRDYEPPGRGQAARPALRARARDRLTQLVQFESAGGGGA
jgi:4-hydroxy-3-methylbut-2-enyl diphosphate reductase